MDSNIRGSNRKSNTSSSKSSSSKLNDIFSPRPKDYGTLFEVNNKSFNYKSYDDKFIVGFLGPYKEELTQIFYIMYDAITPSYKCCIRGKPGKLRYSNVCGSNSMHICKEVNFDDIKKDTGFSYKKQKILIHDNHWLGSDIVSNENREIIEKVFGDTYGSIGASYHALAHFTLTKGGKTYYIAIETTICRPYQLQFYVGKSKAELTDILMTRYLCSGYFLTSNCNAWFVEDEDNGVILVDDDTRQPLKDSEGGRKRRKTNKRNKKYKKRYTRRVHPSP